MGAGRARSVETAAGRWPLTGSGQLISRVPARTRGGFVDRWAPLNVCYPSWVLDFFGLDSEQARWVFGQSAAIVVLIAWLVSVLRQLASSRRQIEKLSDSLVQTTERAWQSRWKDATDFGLRVDSNQRNLLDGIASIVGRPKSSASGSVIDWPLPPPSPPPPKRAKPAESEPVPPPLPDAPPPPSPLKRTR
jgi:hypothetical protein